jgi:hypothetical protein
MTTENKITLELGSPLVNVFPAETMRTGALGPIWGQPNDDDV